MSGFIISVLNECKVKRRLKFALVVGKANQLISWDLGNLGKQYNIESARGFQEASDFGLLI